MSNIEPAVFIVQCAVATRRSPPESSDSEHIPPIPDGPDAPLCPERHLVVGHHPQQAILVGAPRCACGRRPGQPLHFIEYDNLPYDSERSSRFSCATKSGLAGSVIAPPPWASWPKVGSACSMPVVTIVALKGQGLIAAVKARKDVRLIQVTNDNRDVLPGELEGLVRTCPATTSSSNRNPAP